MSELQLNEFKWIRTARIFLQKNRVSNFGKHLSYSRLFMPNFNFKFKSFNKEVLDRIQTFGLLFTF